MGGYGKYSLIKGETEDLNYYPRLAGLPILPTRLIHIKFAEANGTTDFNQVDEIEFQAALLNPLDVSRRELKVINNQSVIQVQLKRRILVDGQKSVMEVNTVRAAENDKLVWTLPPTGSPNVSAEENLDGRLAKLEGVISYEQFYLPGTNGIDKVEVGRLVLRLTPDQCQVELLGGLSPLDDGDFVLVGYGGRETTSGESTFGFETPKLEAVMPSKGMLPLPLLRTTHRITLDSPLRVLLAVDELASSFSLVSAEDNGKLTWWDIRTAKPWSSLTLDSEPTDLSAGHLQTMTIIYSYGMRLQAIDAELKCDWLPGAAQIAGDVRTDWSAGEPITALAASGDRFFIGNAQGRLLGWDDFGKRKFAVDLFTGSILQLAAASTPSGSVIVALDSTLSMVSVIDGTTGEILIERLSSELFKDDMSSRFQIRQIAVRWINNNLVLAILCEGGARWWRINREKRALEPSGRTPADDKPDAIAIGAEGTSLALFYTAGGRIFSMLDNGNVTDIGAAPGSNTSIDFGQDEKKQLLAAVARSKAISLWERDLINTTWTNRNLSSIPEDEGERLAVFLERVGTSWTVTTGPGERLADIIEATSRIVQVFDTTDGKELLNRTIPNAVPQAGLLGPRLTMTSLPSPHAALCEADSSEVSMIDLRVSQKRFQLLHNDNTVVCAARFGRFNDGTSVLLTTTTNAVFCWNNALREKLYEFEFNRPVTALAVDGTYAAVAADKIRLWQLTKNPTINGAETIQFGEDNWVPMRVALRVAENKILVVTAAQSKVNKSYRLEIWDVAIPLGTPRLRLSWAVDGEIRDVVILDAATIAISRGKPECTGTTVEILNVPAMAQAPVVRWSGQLNANTAVRLTTLTPPGETDSTLVSTVDDNASIGVWALAPRLKIASDGSVDLHLPVKLLSTSPGIESISADILPGGKAILFLTKNNLRLHPASVYRESFGFIAGLTTAGTNAGNLAVCLWRNVNGNISGSMVDEITERKKVQLVDGGNQPITIDASAYFIERKRPALPSSRTSLT